MDKVLAMVHDTFLDGTLSTLELGVRDGRTSRGIHEFFKAAKRIHFHTGIDNGRDMGIVEPYVGCHMIEGNTMEVYNQIPANSQHFIFNDANHSFPMTVIDIFCYAPKVRVNGFFAMHDTGPQIPKFKDWQGMGSKDDADMFISCRKAAEALGLLNDRSYVNGVTFQKVMDVYDETKDTGGMLVLKRIL